MSVELTAARAGSTAVEEVGGPLWFVLVVDDTIGTFGNVNLLGVADVVLTSLTETFSGLADVMEGSYGFFVPLPFSRNFCR